MSGANSETEQLDTNENEDELVVDVHSDSEPTGEPAPSANTTSECSEADCHTSFLPGHNLCIFHSPCIKDDTYLIKDCVTCALALNKIRYEVYDSAAKTSEWRFLISTFWTIQARRERANLAPPLLWNRDDYTHLFPQSLLEGSARTEFRHEFFPDLDKSTDPVQNIDSIRSNYFHSFAIKWPIQIYRPFRLKDNKKSFIVPGE